MVDQEPTRLPDEVKQGLDALAEHLFSELEEPTPEALIDLLTSLGDPELLEILENVRMRFGDVDGIDIGSGPPREDLRRFVDESDARAEQQGTSLLEFLASKNEDDR